MTKGPPRTLSFDQLVQSSGGTPGPTTWRQRPFKTFVSQNLGDSLVVSKAWLSKRQVPQDLGDFSRNVDGDCCRHSRAVNKTCISSHRQNIKVLRQTLGKLAFLAKVWVSISCQHLQVKHVRPTSELLNWAFQILTRLIS